MKIQVSEPQVIAYDAGIYSSFPDILKTKDGYLCAYREADQHHPLWSKIVLLRSTDGNVWEREKFAESSMKKNEEVFNCPRLSRVGKKIALVCDAKSSQSEGSSTWHNYIWWSTSEGESWSNRIDLQINGLVPDRIVGTKKKLIMGYHMIEPVGGVIGGPPRLVQMMAESYDSGLHWRDRRTITCSTKHDFCEGSIVPLDDENFICYLRDNKGPVLRSYYCRSKDAGNTWSPPAQMNFMGHRIVAGVKQNEPYAGVVLGTFRNTLNKSIGLFVENARRKRAQMFTVDTESKPSLYDFGYTGWAETNDGCILVVYYITRDLPNPQICTVKVDFY